MFYDSSYFPESVKERPCLPEQFRLVVTSCSDSYKFSVSSEEGNYFVHKSYSEILDFIENHDGIFCTPTLTLWDYTSLYSVHRDRPMTWIWPINNMCIVRVSMLEWIRKYFTTYVKILKYRYGNNSHAKSTYYQSIDRYTKDLLDFVKCKKRL